MKWKKILISSSIGVAAAIPVITMAVIGANPRADQASSNFLMDFSTLANNKNADQTNQYVAKNEYINNIKNDVNEVFKEYKKINTNPKLTLDFRTLKTSMPPGELNYFTELNKALLGINENLSFNLIPRSPVSVQEGFYQRNSDMVSFYWSPDYNDIGTWLTYMFGDFQVANMWPALSAAINKTITPSNDKNNKSKSSWVESLAARLTEIEVHTSDGSVVKLVTKESDNKYKALSEKEIFDLLNKGVRFDEISTAIGNIISSWISTSSSIEWDGELDPNAKEQNGFYDTKGGFKDKFTPSMQTNFLDFVSSYNPNIPNYQDGANTKTTFLVRNGFHVPTNPNGTNNYRDWYSKLDTKDNYIEYMAGSPFASTVTSLNPCFTKASSATFFQTNFSTLFSWTSKHDFTSDATDESKKGKFDVQLVSQATTAPISEFKTVLENAINGSQTTSGQITSNISNKDKKEFSLEIPIRAIPWINAFGQKGENERFLSPLDFLVGIAAYKKSLELKLNSNNYFIKLIGLDIEKTLVPLFDNANNKQDLINTSKTDNKKLTLHFKNPQLSSNNIADILSIQYFSALPHFSPKVQNILKIDSSKPFNPQGSEWDQYYACGYQTNAWKDCWYTTPYYINNITDQYWEMKLNKEFFEMFKEEIKTQTNKKDNDYIQFDLTPTIDGIEYKKIDKLKFFYNSSGFSEQTLFEMFKSGETDKSQIPTSSLTLVMNDTNLKQQIYAPEVLKLAKSDLIPYNLQVYMKSSNGVPRILNSKNKEVSNENISDKLATDKFGNLAFINGYKPYLKSNIDAAYYDLIVKNFYTPIDAKDENGELLPILDRSSAIIRTAINDCINWLRLSSVVSQSQSKTMQNSFLPFGVASLPTENGKGQVELAENRLKYWSLSAYKLSANEHDKIGQRMGGILEWSILDYFEEWKSSINKK